MLELYGNGSCGPRCSRSSTCAATVSCSSTSRLFHHPSKSSVYSIAQDIWIIARREYAVNAMGSAGSVGYPTWLTSHYRLACRHERRVEREGSLSASAGREGADHARQACRGGQQLSGSPPGGRKDCARAVRRDPGRRALAV